MKRAFPFIAVMTFAALTSCAGPAGPAGKDGTNGSIPVASIAITSAGGVVLVSPANGLLQFSAAVLPADASNQVLTWSVVDATLGTAATGAVIDANGVLTGTGLENVIVAAAAEDGSGIKSNAIDVTVGG
jgi:hypothetical protein